MMGGLLPYYGALTAAILFGVAGQVLLKSGAVRSPDGIGQFLDPFTIVGLGAYGLAAICYVAAIKKLPLTLAFPSVSLSYVLVAFIAHYAWNEPLGWPQLGGIALITGGILLLHQS
jgi:small multidrug resistance pump